MSVPTPVAASRAGLACAHRRRSSASSSVGLAAERLVASCECAQRPFRSGGDLVGGRVGAQAGAGVDEGAARQSGELVFELFGGGDEEAVDLVDRAGAGLERRASSDVQHPDCFHQTVAAFGLSCGFAAQRGARRGFGVGGVGLAVAPPRLAVGTVHLHHRHADRGEVARQAGAVAAGAFHADDPQRTPGPQPGDEFAVAGHSRRERRRVQHPPRPVHGCGDVVVTMGVHPTDHFNRFLRHNGAALLRANQWVKGTTGRDGGQDTQGVSSRLLSGHVRPTGRCASPTSTRPTDRKQGTTANIPAGQTHHQSGTHTV